MNFFETEKPIGVFDSGIGGLTVVKRLLSTLPNENIVYFGDTARVPYGSKSNETVIEYSLQDAQFLINKNVKLIVVACNTASSVAIPALKEKFSVPIVEMIGVGSEAAKKATVSGKIGVIGTRATINNKAYSTAMHKTNPALEVYEAACPLFVPLAEEGWIDHSATRLIVREYLAEVKEHGVDTLVLGCTHYPILAGTIQAEMGEGVKLIDSGVAAADQVRKELDRLAIGARSAVPGNVDFYVSDLPQKFSEIAELFLGRRINNVHRVDPEVLQNILNQ